MRAGLRLFATGVLLVRAVLQNGYRQARSLERIGSDRSQLLEWMRKPGDRVCIPSGAVPLPMAVIKGCPGLRTAA